MKLRKHMISRVLPDSIAEELGLEPGDRLVSVNGQPVEDVFDYRYLMNEELVVLLIEKPDGEEWELEVEKEYEEDLGIEFENGGLMLSLIHILQKQKLKVQKLHHKIDNIRTDYINKTIAEIVKTKPSYITIEDLNVNGMMKNRHLSKAVASQKFYEFRTKLQIKCNENGIELRIVDRWYPSSKTCHCCGAIKKDLKLSDRIFKCSCGYVEDRDLNAALNLRDAITYEVA